MKLYELFAKIGKGEIKEGTRVINQGLEDEYIIKNGDLRLCCNDNLFAGFNTERLSDEVEIIEPAKDNNGDIKEIIVVPDDLRKRISSAEDKLNEVIRAANKLNRNEDAKRFG